MSIWNKKFRTQTRTEIRTETKTQIQNSLKLCKEFFNEIVNEEKNKNEAINILNILSIKTHQLWLKIYLKQIRIKTIKLNAWLIMNWLN